MERIMVNESSFQRSQCRRSTPTGTKHDRHHHPTLNWCAYHLFTLFCLTRRLEDQRDYSTFNILYGSNKEEMDYGWFLCGKIHCRALKTILCRHDKRAHVVMHSGLELLGLDSNLHQKTCHKFHLQSLEYAGPMHKDSDWRHMHPRTHSQHECHRGYMVYDGKSPMQYYDQQQQRFRYCRFVRCTVALKYRIVDYSINYNGGCARYQERGLTLCDSWNLPVKSKVGYLEARIG